MCDILSISVTSLSVPLRKRDAVDIIHPVSSVCIHTVYAAFPLVT